MTRGGGIPPPATLFAEPLLPTDQCTMIAQGAEAVSLEVDETQ